MRRHPALIPLSRDHHSGLVQALRLRRAAAGGDASARLAAASEFVEFFRNEERVHLREELIFLIPKVDTLLAPEELPEVPGRRKPSGSISVRGSTAQPHCLHESTVMVAREGDQGGVAPHSTTLERSVVRAMLGELHARLDEDELVVNMVTHLPDDHEACAAVDPVLHT